MPRRSHRLFLGFPLLLVVFAGCDAFGDDDFPAPAVAWARPGATATFDYVAGLDSVRDAFGEAYPTTPHAATFTVETDVLTAVDDGPVGLWSFAYDGFGASPVYLAFRLPLYEERLTTTEYGLAVVDRLTCDPLGAGPKGFFAWVRVPREPGDLREYICGQRAGRLLTASPLQTVETPAGTFEAFTLEGPAGVSDVQREFWAWEDGLVRLDLFSAEGVLRGSLVRSR